MIDAVNEKLIKHINGVRNGVKNNQYSGNSERMCYKVIWKVLAASR